jgi:hypothetical protein
MQPHEHKSENSETFGIASIDVNLYPAGFAYDIIDFTIEKNKAE